MKRNDEQLVPLRVRWRGWGWGMNDWVDSPVLVLRRWHGVGGEFAKSGRLFVLVYMNDEYQKGALRERRERGGGGVERYLLSCRFYTVADNIMNIFSHALLMCFLFLFFLDVPDSALRIWISFVRIPLESELGENHHHHHHPTSNLVEST